MTDEINVSSEEKYQLIDITDRVEKIVKESGIKDGLVLVFVPHSTAGILLTENEAGLKEDWLSFLKRLVSGFDPEAEQARSGADFQHNRIDDNADSHILSGLIGQEKVFPLKGGRLLRGIWQQIFLLELDGPRNRKIIVEVN
ncbi:hypothetical protein COY65_02630 [Candidatus Jorgensenbacteria bacterium CG_4_10_14_0_8_um_filter_39_13]|uniref:Secondary thiamine-phosphate synthase enzyme n=2 Tax=Candidatus Joergenseniibacteriota TaxID=1752739 RepID=A0A2M7RGG7_9BACT|nr:MAG: hypothetical protein COV54_01555 [Candidatus Jorgensenbacteria bacterium CG11_big_fil_rev_8_21_14_0_20_38_23]PIV13378.1 MAG: hypothetical protein COS46_00500 [Candidatus Jorgensenbacteria bacterium CG03_land_8_20_14_0_80_38_39]PIW97388.1 MAG: hypothetical protein COZ81_02795 [Candidatus Jorgensenbacteria bacterium CG_4_8_14_3_um_filter_38_10]PIY95657.1 MAG: hypothetical protein COY65_02630 [Candidatus Jorgensenbacteria bacterium CG_4_10_14_0_8_um_filter_39_13]